MPGILGTYRNLILRGGLAAVPHPTLFLGSGTFIDRSSVFGGSVVEGSGMHANDAPVFNYFFGDLGASVDDVFGSIWLRLRPVGGKKTLDTSRHGPTVLQLVDLQRSLVQ